MFNTPILFIIFNRPHTAQKVFDVIKKQKPKYLFVAADGPRPGNHEDIKKCQETRNIIKQIDWDCELKTLFRDENRGCGYGPAEAITWFFDNVEQGIILEDDVLPHPSFFPFCEELLERFKNDERISMISGINFLGKWKNNKYSYIFSNLGSTPGWASWRRMWTNFDYNLINWKNKKYQNNIKNNLYFSSIFNYYKEKFDFYAHSPKNDVWDYQWLCTTIAHGFTIVPSVNLISNIGFGDDATHTISSKNIHARLKLDKMSFPLKHSKLKADRLFEWLLFERCINPKKRTLMKKVLLKALKILTNTN